VLLALAAWRVWHLIALDDLTDRPRRYITDGHDALLEFVECPYCLGAWVGGAWVVSFAIWDTGTLWAALVFAVSAGVIAMSHWLTSE
jgi:hypothetical protein